MKWLTKFIKWLASLNPDSSVVPVPSVTPTPPPVAEFNYTPGTFTTRVVDPSGGAVEFDCYVPEDGRIGDWGGHGAEIFALYDGPRSKVKTLAALLPYKAKICNGRSCREPRYNVEWDRWRHVKCEWDADSVTYTVEDAKPIVLNLTKEWISPVVAIHGCVGDGKHPNGHLLEGCKLRNITWA